MQNYCPSFQFKQFGIDDRRCGLKVGTDGVLLGTWACLGRCDGAILDVGAGSGLIGLMLAQRYPLADVTAVEVDADSYADLCLNVEASPWAERFTVVKDDFRTITGKFDLLVCNPPFFTNGERAPQAARALARHASELSPLSFVRFAAGHLTDAGRAAMIAPVELNEAIALEAALAGLYPCRLADVATSARRGITRRLWVFSAEACPPPAADMITVGSEKFQELTSEFYL